MINHTKGLSAAFKVGFRLGVRENRILNGNQLFGPDMDSKTNVCVCEIEREREREREGERETEGTYCNRNPLTELRMAPSQNSQTEERGKVVGGRKGGRRRRERE